MKLAKTYEPQAYEPRIYQLWEESDSFSPIGDPKKGYFSIVLPPPNANGNLHVGHALTIAVEDALIRYNRLKGNSTLFIPGADHAGFETWVVFERNLEKQGKSRFDFSRDDLYQMTWDFVQEQRGNMEVQLRELGASLDWKNLVFTLDKKVIDRTYKTFKKLWDDKLIYRGERIVNYCTKHQTSFADIEVDHKIEKSKLWSVAYKRVDGEGEIVIATTRPETILGDGAVAVYPGDTRYTDFVGKMVIEPVSGRHIPVITDEAVETDFGTGAVKVTVAHDPTDFEIGERHNIPQIQVIGFDGKMTDKCPPEYVGLDVLEARKLVLEYLTDKGLLREAKTYSHSVGHCYKCGTTIQPLIKDQWFIKVQPLAQKAIHAIESGKISFTPENKGKVLLNYLKNLRDWNLSRQIPWGIPIPAFQSTEDPTKWIFDDRVNEQHITVDGIEYKREDDTFDTWFSSGQWPFITTDYLDGGDLSPYYPLSVMETGHDILFPWISRMIMLGIYATDEVPFKHVYLHGLVLDEHGQKMSKSKGNVINPQDVVKEYGSDALRMGLLASRSPGINQAFSTGNVVAGRNFCNKLWNIARFIEDKVGDEYTHEKPLPQTNDEHWIIDTLNQASKKIGSLLDQYRFAEAYELMYHTIWDEVADWYVECSKNGNNKSVMVYVLETCLKIAHPFAPFATETIWQTLAWQKELLITSSWPNEVKIDHHKAEAFASIQQIVIEARFVSASLASGKQKLIFTNDPLIEQNSDLIRRLANLEIVQKVEKGSGLRLAVANHEIWLDVTAETLKKHTDKLQGRLEQSMTQVKHLEQRLSNKGYVDNAPEKVVQETRSQLEESKTLVERLQKELELLG